MNFSSLLKQCYKILLYLLGPGKKDIIENINTQGHQMYRRGGDVVCYFSM